MKQDKTRTRYHLHARKKLNITNTNGWMKTKNKQTKTNSLIPKQLSEQSITPEDMNTTLMVKRQNVLPA